MECYNPHCDRWTTLKDMDVDREGAGLVVAGETIFCIGGYDGVNLLDTAEKYDIKTGTWSPISNMSTKRSGKLLSLEFNNDVISIYGPV